MGRSPCCDKSKVKKGTWSPEEDATLKNFLLKHGTGGNWISLPQKAGLQRCGKSCRLRWLNYLRPDIKHGGFTQEEEYVICSLFNKIGSRWSVIASHLPGRTDNDVKNYWNTKLKKKLMAANCNPPIKSDTAKAIPASSSNTVAATVSAAGAATTSVLTNSLALQDYCFPVPFLPENTTSLVNAKAPSISNQPTNYYNFPTFILEGSSDFSSGSNLSFPLSPSDQDSSPFMPFCLEMDENNGVKIDQYSCDEVLSGIWSQEEAIAADSDADLFSIFHVDSKPQGLSQSH